MGNGKKAAYFDIEPQDGKWYISEGFISKNNPTIDEKKEMYMHNLGAQNMILAGPFSEKAFAEAQLDQYTCYHDPYIWQS